MEKYELKLFDSKSHTQLYINTYTVKDRETCSIDIGKENILCGSTCKVHITAYTKKQDQVTSEISDVCIGKLNIK